MRPSAYVAMLPRPLLYHRGIYVVGTSDSIHADGLHTCDPLPEEWMDIIDRLSRRTIHKLQAVNPDLFSRAHLAQGLIALVPPMLGEIQLRRVPVSLFSLFAANYRYVTYKAGSGASHPPPPVFGLPASFLPGAMHRSPIEIDIAFACDPFTFSGLTFIPLRR